MSRLGKYGTAFLNSLKESQPETYAKLAASGDLDQMASEIQERAQSQFETLLANLQEQNPLPSHPVDRVTALLGLESQANELVMEEVLVPAPDDSEPPERQSRLSLRTLATFSDNPPTSRLRAPRSQ